MGLWPRGNQNRLQQGLEISLSNPYNILKVIQMQEDKNPRPERFQTYVELPSKLGFTIKDTNHVFYYDKYGGWKDEYGNYYNRDGIPDEEPDSESEKTVSQGSWDQFEDEFEKQFAPSTQVQEEFQKTAARQEAITLNNQILESHNKENPLRVNFKVEGVAEDQDYPTEKQLIQVCRKKVKGLNNVYYDGPDQDTGYFVVDNVRAATSLIQLQQQNLGGYQILFEVEPVEELKEDPLNQDQLQDRFPKFVDVGSQQKIYTFSLQNHTGFGDKKLFKAWLQNLKKNLKVDVIKMKVIQQKSKIPIVKMLQKQVGKLKEFPYEGKQIIVEPYVSRKKQVEGQSKEEQTTQVKKQEVQEPVKEAA